LIKNRDNFVVDFIDDTCANLGRALISLRDVK